MTEDVGPAAGTKPARARGLSPMNRRTARAIAAAAMPAGEKIPAPGEEVVERLDAFIAGAPGLVAFGFRMLLRVLELGAILFHLRPFSRLPPEKAARYLGRWASSRIFWLRIALRGALTPIKLSHHADPAISRLLGYDPPAPVAPEPTPGWMTGARPADAVEGETVKCQVVVVGSGPGGALMATRLAEKGLDVVVLEEGRYFHRHEFNRRPFQMTQQMYRDLGLTVALGVPGIPIPLGKTVGGTSTINSGTCFRVPERVLTEWREDFGLGQFTPDLLAPHYDECESFLKVQPVPEAVLGKVAEVIRRGADKLGYSHRPLDRNADRCQGSGVCCFGCPTGAKQSMNLSYVPRALNAGAKLLTGARVETIVREGRTARGVVARTAEGRRLEVRADAVVVACGTLYTPILLMNSRVSDRSGSLGNNLSIHPAAKVAALFEEKIRGWEGVPQGYCIDEFKEEGIVFEGASVPPEYGAIGLPQIGKRFTEIMEAYEHLAFFGFLIEDESRGKVRPGPGGSPRIHYNLKAPGDLMRLKRGAETLSRVFFEAGAHTVLPPIAGLEELSSPEELARIQDPSVKVRDFELTAFHPLGTCRMGVSPEKGVLDPGLEVWSTDNLFVADGSVFPSSLGVNPQMTIMAISSLAAEHVAARVGGSPRHAAGGGRAAA
jgi:choline dehydrogenase-like flavoprotein